MRTRFLSRDYFNSAPCPPLDFLRLPLPHLPASNASTFDDLHCFHKLPTLSNIDVEIERFPIDETLSRLFSYVFPHRIHVELAQFADPQPFAGKPDFDEQTSGTTNSEGPMVSYGKGKGNLEMVQFEIPELDSSSLPLLEDIPYFGKENMSIPSQISDDENKLDMPDLEVRLQHSLDTLQSICSVDDICSVSFLEKSSDLMEDSDFSQGKYHSSIDVFPLLEVDEAGLGIVSDNFIKEKVLIFENIELQCETPESEGMGNGNELLNSTKFDTFQHLSNGSLTMDCLEVEVPCLNFSLEMDLISIIELEKNSVIHQGIENDGPIWVGSLIIFDELQFFDSDLYNFCEFLSEAKVDIEDTCDLMLREAKNFRNFDELVVSHELIPVDNSFGSLPVPLVSENGNIKSLHFCIKQILAELEPQSFSMSDGLYLDWHFVEEEKFKCREDFFNLSGEIDDNNIDLCLNFIDNEMLISDFFFSSDSPQKPKRVESKEMLSLPSNGIPVSPMPHNIEVSTKLLKDGKFSTEGVSSQYISKKASLFADSWSEFNDLDFFLNPKEHGRDKDYKPADSSVDTNAMGQGRFLPSAATSVQPQQWNIKVHQVLLSSDILLLIDDLRKIFQVIFERRRDLIETQDPSQAVDDIAILRLSKKKLINLIKKRSVCRTSLFQDSDNTMSLVTLSAIKQMVWYLCYYGLHTTYLYIEKLYRSLKGLDSKLDFLYNFIKDVHQKVEKDIHKFHPSLSVIKGILQARMSKGSSKILIVAEPVFWWSVKKLLTSMNISFSQPQNRQKDDFYKLEDASQMIHESHCCLVTQEHLFAPFPFDKFEIILEYGGSQGSSKVSSISPKSDRVPPLHFLKVEMEDPSVAKALCDGVDMPNTDEPRMARGPHSFSTLNEIDVTFEELLNFLPVEKNLKGGSMEALLGNEACSAVSQHAVFSLRSEQNCGSADGCPETIIIVNTHNFDKEMVISRRSTYQKILAFEKKGVQVVERDLRQPVDIIVSASACLAWYDSKNIAKKATAPDEAFSCLPLCVENIAASILMSLSFSFSGCILVFEGEGDFISGIMESSDELYAAAASLGMDIQIFYSYTSEMTEEIILSCIELSSRTSRGLYSKMPESQTLAESFLTAFPSINSLSAHAILSSVGLLVEFLEWPREHRIHAVQKYQVPVESITLLSALSRFGEREDSKSGMTDCSSSVSSAPDSESLHFKRTYGGTKRKTTWDIENLNMPKSELFDFDPPRTFSKGRLHHPRASGLRDSLVSEDINLFDEFGKSSLSFDEPCVHRQLLDTYVTKDLFDVTELCDYQMRKNPQMGGGELNKFKASQIDKCLHPRERVDVGMMNKLDRQNNYSGNLKEDITGEVINIDDTVASGKAFHNAKYKSFSTQVHAMETRTTGVPTAAKKLFFGASDFQEFPTTVEIDSSPDACTSVRDLGQGSRQGMGQHLNAGFNHNKIQFKHQKWVPEEGISQKVNLTDLMKQEKNTACYGETPLSNALQSTRLQQGSPWTIEFLNRIREKSRSRQQSLPCDLSAPCYGYLSKSSKVTKRKSPSTLELYKYQGNSFPEAATRRKRHMKGMQLPASTSEKASDRPIPSWTPIDKRAKRELSFATNGNGGQSKLVWSDKNSHAFGRRY
ncbi:protein SHORTAGE IN CHIASMATA 1 [Lycium ferocissimum]|uniref:protein SHORTAGE IN CHIASMATA 1 n=1 Tax=Lycium ferocissimum TaxID=112874 RepID=UPI0028154B80|nr:protein SHORTAGE IN CHIASMATA 1 [Lycium ferocissimum]